MCVRLTGLPRSADGTALDTRGPVTRFVELAASEILATAGRVEIMLAAQPR